MATEMRTPGILNFSETNMSEAWTKWYQKLNIYMLASNRDKEKDITKIAILLNLIGDEGVVLYNTFKHEEDVEYETVVNEFEQYFSPRKNIIYERFKFYKYTQQADQTFNNFLTELRRLAATCEFDEEQNMIRDKIVLEIRDDCMRERLLAEPKLTLDSAIEACNNYEVRKKQAYDMRKKEEKQVDVIQGKPNKYMAKEKQNKTTYDNINCYRCGKNHAARSCPAYKKKCVKCGRLGHYAIMCKTKNYRDGKLKSGWKNSVLEVDNNDQDEFYIDSIENKNKTTEWDQDVEINNKCIKFKLDTGSECNIIPTKIYKSLWDADHEPKLAHTNMGLLAYGDYKIKPRGTVILKSRIKNKTINVKYVIVDVGNKPILGLNACVKLELVKRANVIDNMTNFESKDEVIQKYKSVFKGLGTFPGEPYKMKIKEGAQPTTQPARRVAQSIQNKLKMTLDKLELDGVIKKVEGPTDWLNPLVIKEKPNKSLRLCLDPQGLNDALIDERFQLPTQDEMFSELNGVTLFTTLDLRDSFYQITLDEESSRLCSFATPFSRYQFLRLPFGIKTAAEVFQKKNTELFGNIPGVKVYIDDIFIAGNENTHDKILKEVLEVASRAGITFNKEKFQFRVKKVKLLGHVITKDGVAIDPDRIEAIKGMRSPTDRQSLLRFLGITKYLSKFIPDLSTVSAPLRDLTKQITGWHWTEEHNKTIEIIKKLITDSNVLRHYDPNLPLMIQTDSSKDGLGSVLLQCGKPIAYASRALTANEVKYAQIEKELLAICFAAEKFHYYIYGRKVGVQTDHKPLVTICRRNMDSVPMRLQRMLLRLFKYNLEVEYLKGSEMIIADALSRAYLQGDGKEDEELQYVVHTVLKQLPLSEVRKQQFKDATSNDDTLMQIRRYIETGWPRHKKETSMEVKQYWAIKDELQVVEDFLIYKDKLIVPKSLQTNILEVIHKGHQGIIKCKMRARGVLYWPDMNAQIERYVSNCHICQLNRNKNPRQPLLQHDITDRPWQKIAMDVGTYQGVDYLIVMDYYSKWLEVIKLKGKTASNIIAKLMVLFATHGYPEVIMSDNVPFSSEEFKKFLRGKDIVGTTSSPNYARSNGLAERAVGMAKKMLSKSRMASEQLHDYLISYRSSPIPGIGLSPAQMLFSRQIKNMMPCLTTHYVPKVNNPQMIRRKLVQRQEQQKYYYDRGTKTLPEVGKGDKVLLRNNNSWKEGEVVSQHHSPRSHMVKDLNNRVVRRNREHMIVIKKESGGGNTKSRERNGGEETMMIRDERRYNFRDRRLMRRPARYISPDEDSRKREGCGVPVSRLIGGHVTDMRTEQKRNGKQPYYSLEHS